MTYRIIDDSNYQAATRTRGDIFAVGELLARDLEAVAAGAWIMVDTFNIIPCHVFNLDLVVVSPHDVREASRLMGVNSELVRECGGPRDAKLSKFWIASQVIFTQ
jgi:hypothetical protein